MQWAIDSTSWLAIIHPSVRCRYMHAWRIYLCCHNPRRGEAHERELLEREREPCLVLCFTLRWLPVCEPSLIRRTPAPSVRWAKNTLKWVKKFDSLSGRESSSLTASLPFLNIYFFGESSIYLTLYCSIYSRNSKSYMYCTAKLLLCAVAFLNSCLC
jgi:hypothetical protein